MKPSLNKTGLSVLLFSFLVVPTFFAGAQTTVPTATSQEAQKTQQAIEQNRVLKAVPGPDQTVQVNHQVLFDATASTNSIDSTLKYRWSFGDGTEGTGVDVTHVYDTPGRYTVMLTVDNGKQKDTGELTVSVFQDFMVLISDGSRSAATIESYQFNASRNGVLLSVIEYTSGEPAYIVEEQLSKLILEKADEVRKAKVIVDATSGSTGLNVLSKFAQQAGDLQGLNIGNKAVVSLQDPSSSLARIAQSTFNILRPQYILMVNDSALTLIYSAKSPEQIIQEIQSGTVTYRIIGTYSERSVSDFRVWNFMSILVDFMINQGVPVNTITLILLLPIIATLIAIARQLIGIKAFGIYTPSIITLAFLAVGLQYGLLIFLAVLLTGSLTRFALKKLRLLFLPRMAIVLTAVALAMIALLAVAAEFHIQALIAISIFPILIMITLVERFVTAQIEKGILEATKLSVETLFLSVVGYFVLSWDPLREFILAYPEIILVTIILNIILGKWTGLRLSEYYRFREIRKYLKE